MSRKAASDLPVGLKLVSGALGHNLSSNNVDAEPSVPTPGIIEHELARRGLVDLVRAATEFRHIWLISLRCRRSKSPCLCFFREAAPVRVQPDAYPHRW
jgi:hypothetical protein